MFRRTNKPMPPIVRRLSCSGRKPNNTGTDGKPAECSVRNNITCQRILMISCTEERSVDNSDWLLSRFTPFNTHTHTYTPFRTRTSCWPSSHVTSVRMVQEQTASSFLTPNPFSDYLIASCINSSRVSESVSKTFSVSLFDGRLDKLHKAE